MHGEGYWLLLWRPDWSPWLCRSTTEAALIRGVLMEDSCQRGSIHVHVFLHRKVGVNAGCSDQLALAESGLLTLDPCWVVLPINPFGLSWSWCSVLSSGSAKHTATFTLQLPLSVSLSVSLLLVLTSGALDCIYWLVITTALRPQSITPKRLNNHLKWFKLLSSSRFIISNNSVIAGSGHKETISLTQSCPRPC